MAWFAFGFMVGAMLAGATFFGAVLLTGDLVMEGVRWVWRID